MVDVLIGVAVLLGLLGAYVLGCFDMKRIMLKQFAEALGGKKRDD